MWSNDCNIEAFQCEVDANNKYERECTATEHEMPSSQHVSHTLDFSHVQSDIKQEKDREDFNVPKLKKHFPGTKKASYEDLQEQFQSRKRKTTPSPGRAAKSGFGSPPAKQAKIGENYKDMMDTKQKVIACGTEVLKKKKNAKNLDAIIAELDSMGREYCKHLNTASTISCLISTANTVNSLILHEVYKLKMISSISF